MNMESVTYRVFLAVTTDSDLCSRSAEVHEVTDGHRRFAWVAGVHSQYIVAFTHCHRTVARYVVPVAILCANVHLHRHEVINQQ